MHWIRLERCRTNGSLRSAWLLFFYVVIMLVTHHITHLSVATVALTGALIALLLGGHKMGKVLEKIDYPTICFFAGLFIIVAAMEHVGLA